MLRNELFNNLSRYDNDPVFAVINGVKVGIEGSVKSGDGIELKLDADDFRNALKSVSRPQPAEPNA